MGIGLTLVRSLVELHGGTISIESEGPGCGSEFTVRLPILSGTTVMPRESGNAVRAESFGALRILVVDDSSDSALTLGVILELQGHEIATANDGLSAIQLVSTWAPDVVLLDIGLPGMDGYQVARKLREGCTFDRLKLIALTGYGGDEVRSRAIQAGFDFHFVKPVNLEELVKVLATIRRRVEPI